MKAIESALKLVCVGVLCLELFVILLIIVPEGALKVWEWSWPVVVVVLATVLPAGYRVVTTEGGTHRHSATCVSCRYDLTGLGEMVRCPECGTADARLRHDTPKSEVRLRYQTRLLKPILAMSLMMWLAGRIRVWVYCAVDREWCAWIVRYDTWIVELNRAWPVVPTLLGGAIVWGIGRLGVPPMRPTIAIGLTVLVAAGAHALSVEYSYWPSFHEDSLWVACLTLAIGTPVVLVCGRAARALRWGLGKAGACAPWLEAKRFERERRARCAADSRQP